MQFRLLLTSLVEVFRFIKRYRERADAKHRSEAAERQRERQHQLLILEGMMNKLIEFAKANNEAVIALAKAQSAQADAFHAWLKQFQVPAGELPAPQTYGDDPWEGDVELAEALGVKNLPSEFQLAAVLDRLDKGMTEEDAVEN